jgi:hypothetical protein
VWGGKWDGVVDIAIVLRASRSEVRIPIGAGGLSFLQNVQTDSVAHPASYSVGTGILSPGGGGGGVKVAGA